MMAGSARIRLVLKWVGATVAALILIVALTAALADWNSLRDPVARLVAARTGRPVRITGSLDVHLRWLTPRISVAGLEIGNPPWAGKGAMAHIERLTFELQLLSLLEGDVVLPSVRIEKPAIYLVRNSDGIANWDLKKTGAANRKPATLPLIRHFELQDGRLTYVDYQRKLRFTGVVTANDATSGDPTAGGNSQPFRLVGLGTMNGQPFRFQMRGAPLINIRRDRPYPYEVELTSGLTNLTAQGTIAKPFDLGAYTAEVSIAGDDMAELYHLTGLAFPNTTQYGVYGHVTRKGTRIDVTEAAGTVGSSDIHGDVSVDVGRARPFVTARLTSHSLNLDDVTALFGATPANRSGNTAAPAHAVPAHKMQGPEVTATSRLLPDARLQVERVRAMDARVQYEADAVTSRRFPVRKASMQVTLDNGVLSLNPISLVLSQGTLLGSLRLDARSEVPQIDVDFRIAGVKLEQFHTRNSTDPPFEGVLLGRVTLHGIGDSVHRFASTSSGTATFVLPHGEVREALAELTGINVTRGLGLLVRNDQKETAVRCAVANFKVQNGTMHAQNLVFDTENVLITGKGEVNLRDEALDLVVQGRPKRLRFLRVKSPVTIRGPLRKPSIGLEAGNALGQTGIAAALGALLGPLGAVLAFVDPGLEKDANCSALLEEAQHRGAPLKTAEVTHADQPVDPKSEYGADSDHR